MVDGEADLYMASMFLEALIPRLSYMCAPSKKSTEYISMVTFGIDACVLPLAFVEHLNQMIVVLRFQLEEWSC
jgi:hypothetical protein